MTNLKIYFIFIGLFIGVSGYTQESISENSCSCGETNTYLYKKKDTLSFQEKKIYLNECSKNNPDSIQCFYGMIYLVINDLVPYKEFELAISELETLEKKYLKNKGKLEPETFLNDLGSIYNTKSKIYNSNGYYDLATSTIDKAIRLFEDSDKLSDVLLTSYIFKGDVQKKAGKYIEAIDTYLQALELIRPNQDSLRKYGRIAKYNAYLGTCYKELHNYDEAVQYYRNAIENVENDTFESNEALAMANIGLSSCYALTDKAQLAFDHLVEAENGKIKYTSIKNSIFKQKVAIAKHLGSEDLERILNDRLAFNIKTFGSKHFITNEVYCQLAQYFLDQNDPETASIWARKALSCAWAVEINEVEQQIRMKAEPIGLPIEHLITSLNIYSEATLNLPNEISDFDGVEAAWNASLFAIDLLKEARLSFKNEEEQQLFTEINHQTFEKALTILYRRYQASPSREKIEQAFDLMEASKAFTLRLAAARNRAKQFSNVPVEILQKENALLAGIKEIEFMVKDGEAVRNVVIEHEENKDLLFLRSEYSALQKEIAEKYPDYFKLKSTVHKVSLDVVQKELIGDNTTILEYFLSESSGYLLLANKNDAEFIKLDLADDFFENLNTFLSLVNDNITFDHADQVQAYEKLAHDLYIALLDPVKQQLSERLQIIPDGVLLLLPFDALLTDQVEKSGFYVDYPFLLKEKAIQYNFSAAMWSEMLNAEGAKTSKMLCAYAPIFEGDSYVSDKRDGTIPVGSLKYNMEEARTIKKIFKGKLFSGATSGEFKSSCSDCQIVHIASHAKASSGIQDESWILFNSEADSTNEEKLQLHEIYNLDLNSDLLVLSACETAGGKMVKGEGILSFARSFSFAGTKSILTSLWKVDDEATKDIMALFYKNLQLGESKDLALQNAKIQYLKSARKNAPNYWAAFVAVGDMTPISSNSAPLIYWIVLPIAILLWYFIRKRRLNSN